MREIEILEQKQIREKMVNRTEVLDKVGALLLLKGTEYATSEQVANYYGVEINAIQKIWQRNSDELFDDGAKAFKKDEIIRLLNTQEYEIKNYQGKSVIYTDKYALNIPNRGMKLFPKRAILRIGMLLTESDISRKIRGELLKQNPELYHELSKENQLRFKKYEEEIGNYLEFSFGEENVKRQVICGKYKLDFLLFNQIIIEVDENGHSGYDKSKEKERMKYICDNTSYYPLRYNPQKQKPYMLMMDIIELFDNIGYPNNLADVEVI